MKNSIVISLIGAMLTLMTTVAQANVGINVKAGTLGAGFEVSKSVSDKLNLSLGLNTYVVKTTDNSDGIDYDFNYDLRSVALLAHYHAFNGVFRLTGGLLYNKNELRLTGIPGAGSTYVINGVSYSASQVGSLSGKLTFNTTAPYLGVGWGNRPSSKLGLTADVGVLYQGPPKLSLSASGTVPGLASNVEQERKSAEADLAEFKWYPVVSLGVYMRF